MAEQTAGSVGAITLKNNFDIYVGVAIVGVLSLLIIPLPPLVLDLFLAANLTIALAILMVCLYTTQPLDFSVFPSVILVTTLYRLALNIASTRLILLHGNEGTEAAGTVIKAFGQFVVGGNYVVGAVMFLILVVINFMVITKGAGRVAEVSARFTLDAMPGKQMAIDADLSSGLITEQEARERRKRIAREADFYGAMDGASKFVSGDAIAAIIIMLINIFGGLIIGVFQQGMPLVNALQNYTLLTVGEGLVAQIPAIIISTAAGILVTRSADEQNFGYELSGQIFNYPTALYLVSSILFTMGLIPGLPHFAFFLLSGVAFLVAQTGKRRSLRRAQEEMLTKETAVEEGGEPTTTVRPLEMLELEVGYALVPLVDAAQQGELLERIKGLRKQFAQKYGFVVPPIHIHDNLQLKPTEYNILIRGARIGGGDLSGGFLAMDGGSVIEEIPGTRTTEPVFGLPAVWIRPEDRERAQIAGYTVVDNTTILATHLSEVIRRHAHELVGRQELQQLLDNLAATAPKVVEDLIPGILNLGTVLRVVKNLLKEGVSIRDLRGILETLADYGSVTKDPEMLTEFVRQALARTIVDPLKRDDDTLLVMTLAPDVEEAITDSVQFSEQGSYLAIEPTVAQRILAAIRNLAESFDRYGSVPVLLASPNVRRHVKKLTERFLPTLTVLSHNEIPQNVKIQAVGVVQVDAG